MKSKFVGNNQYSNLSDKDRFWQKVDVRSDNECWEWKAHTHHQWGYGAFKLGNRVIAAHRYSWELHNGSIPDGLIICHKCDNPSCVNPNHLFLGTHQDNSDDRVSKGRSACMKGERNSNSKLSSKDVLNIVRLHRSGKHSGAELGRKFGVVKEVIYDILSGKRWSSVTGIEYENRSTRN